MVRHSDDFGRALVLRHHPWKIIDLSKTQFLGEARWIWGCRSSPLYLPLLLLAGSIAYALWELVYENSPIPAPPLLQDIHCHWTISVPATPLFLDHQFAGPLLAQEVHCCRTFSFRDTPLSQDLICWRISNVTGPPLRSPTVTGPPISKDLYCSSMSTIMYLHCLRTSTIVVSLLLQPLL